jgi:predicted ATP-grasp superfamily ATP-dependent carboligase
MANEAKPAPWLIAGWPGMGNVAVIAAGYLVHHLDMRPVGELPAQGHFDISEVEVKDGLIASTKLPRGVFYRWSNKKGGRDLIVFLGEAQPSSGSYAYAHELVEAASRMGVERVVTFASMASGLHPSENPRVFGVASDKSTLEELRRAEVEPLADGQIGGLNGLVLAVAGERGLSGMGLLAEIPFFAAAVPNPKAARVALSVFSILADIEVSLEELGKHAAAMDAALVEALEKLERQGASGETDSEESEEADDEEETGDGAEATAKPAQPQPPEKLDYAARSRIERMFVEARSDRSKAMRLKEELDRLGIYSQYEDRFLDLFRRAE